MRDVLVGTNNNDAPAFASDPAQVEDVFARPAIGAEHLLVIAQAVNALVRAQERRHFAELKFPEALLEHCAYVEHRVYVVRWPPVAVDRRSGVGFEIGA